MKDQLQIREEQLSMAMAALEFYKFEANGLVATDALLRISQKLPLPVVRKEKL